MAASSAVKLHRIPLSDRLAGLAIVVGAVLACLLCLANGSLAACLGVLLVFGMALVAVATGRSDAAAAAKFGAQRFHMPAAWATRSTRRLPLPRPAWGRARWSY